MNINETFLFYKNSQVQGGVLTGFLFPVNPMKKKKRKEIKKRFLEYH